MGVPHYSTVDVYGEDRICRVCEKPEATYKAALLIAKALHQTKELREKELKKIWEERIAMQKWSNIK